LIHWHLEALLSVGITEVAVVVGHEARRVVSALREECHNVALEFIENRNWRGGNALSLYAARSFVAGGRFVLCMGAHLVSPQMLASLVSRESTALLLCVDSGPWHSSQTNDATRVFLGPEGFVEDIGKHLERWNAVDAGIFGLDDRVFPAIAYLGRRQGIEVEMSDVVRLFRERNDPFATCDIAGLFWADIDTVEDYRTVNRLMSERVLTGGW